MRVPIARHGLREILIAAAVAIGLGGACFGLGVPGLAALPALLLLGVLAFFRDPTRRIPAEDGAVVSPADGKVVAIRDLDHEEFIDGPVVRIDIFLSVADVHVNRAPLAGEVAYSELRDGPYLNALDIEAGDKNRARSVGFVARDGGFRVLVRQIVGAIARRIVSTAAIGDGLERGERIGMIKFGSRTQLSIPKDVPFEVSVAVGDRVRGGASILGFIRRKP